MGLHDDAKNAEKYAQKRENALDKIAQDMLDDPLPPPEGDRLPPALICCPGLDVELEELGTETAPGKSIGWGGACPHCGKLWFIACWEDV